MANIIRRAGWNLPERRVTPESVYANRRDFLRRLGFGTMGALGGIGLAGCSKPEVPPQEAKAPLTNALAAAEAPPGKPGYPYPRNPGFSPGWKLTEEIYATHYNNFYEFTTAKDRVHKLVDKFVTTPWPLEIGGLVENPMKLDAEELAAMMPLEERVYRFRCVEAWAMIVPWTGFPLAKLMEKVVPKAEAKFIRFQTFHRPSQAPGFADLAYPWPYTEGLRLDEAMNPLTLVATGIYGKPLPKQNGAPIRIVVPWKYGYKSIKSVVKIELTDKQPATLWETIAPEVYPFESNIDPNVQLTNWSQKTERLIDTGDRVKTLLYNGYGDFVSKLYPRA